MLTEIPAFNSVSISQQRKNLWFKRRKIQPGPPWAGCVPGTVSVCAVPAVPWRVCPYLQECTMELWGAALGVGKGLNLTLGELGANPRLDQGFGAWQGDFS